MRIAAAVLGLLAIAAVSGCSSNSETPDSVADPAGRVFISTQVDGTPIPGGGPLSLDFIDARPGGGDCRLQYSERRSRIHGRQGRHRHDGHHHDGV